MQPIHAWCAQYCTVLYCTVLYCRNSGARKGRRARGAENFSRSARARTGEKVHKSSRILHALLKKTCKTGGCLLKISDQDLPPPLSEPATYSTADLHTVL